MAGDWIKVEISTASKPEVVKLARILGMDRYAVFGRLIAFWAWMDANSVDGVVDGVVDGDVDALVDAPGFTQALQQVGWIVIDSQDERIEAPHFERHNGKSAKNRALKSQRQADWRRRKSDAVVDGAASTSCLPEKRREEKILEKDLPNGKSKKKTLPAENWQPSGTTRDWFADQPFRFTVDDMTEQYVQGCRAKGHKYIDHDAAFRNWSKRRHETDQRAGAARETQAGRFARRLGIA